MYAIRFSLETFHLIFNSPSFIIYPRYLSGSLGVPLMDGGLAGNFSEAFHPVSLTEVKFNLIILNVLSKLTLAPFSL